MQSQPSSQRGFSLIELTVALLIITTLATIAVRSTNDLSFQVRYDQTKDRLEQIKQAIIGNQQRTVNGQPDISGFVADMGRLPVNLHELLEQNYCSDRSYSTQATCEANSGTWNMQTTWQTNAISGLSFGWRGPYLNISNNALDDNAINDGWGMFTSDKTNHNYGWVWLINTPNANDLTIASYGKDQSPSGNCSDSDFNGDCSVQILATDYQFNLPVAIDVNVTGRTFSLDSRCSNSSYTTRTDCESNNGVWYGGCSAGIASSPSYANKERCEAAGHTWNSCSQTAYTTHASCESNQGIWFGDGYGCTDGVSLTEATCTAASKDWYYCSDHNQHTQSACEATSPASNWFGDGSSESRGLCLRIYSRPNITTPATSTPSITEDGKLHSLTFSLPANTALNIGQASIGIYYQRIDGCQTAMPYPLDSRPLPISLYSRMSFPSVISWR